MGDLREYSFGDWVRIFVKVVPAYMLATLLIVGPIAVIGALVWLFIPLR